MDQNEASCYFCRDQMGPDEYVLWHGKPEKRGRLLAPHEVGSLLFSIFWTVISCTMCIAALTTGSGLAVLFVLIFPLVGIGLIVSQLIKINRLRNHTEYVITNKRLYRHIGPRIENYPASVTLGYEMEYHRNGNATFRFPMAIDRNAGTVRVNGRYIPQYISLVNIGDIDRVQSALASMNSEH